MKYVSVYPANSILKPFQLSDQGSSSNALSGSHSRNLEPTILSPTKTRYMAQRKDN